MITSKAAKRYAKAFFNLSKEKAKVEVVAKDFEAILDLIEKSNDLKVFLKAPLIQSDDRIKALKSIFEGKIDGLTLEFLLFLEKKSRLSITQDTALEFAALNDVLNNIQRVSITSAFKMDQSQVDAISKRLKEKLNKNIVAEVKVDSDLIGGFTVKVGDVVHDLSVATQLNKLKQSIVKA